MTLCVAYHDVNEAYPDLQMLMKSEGVWEETRNGRALVYPSPVIVSHTMPYRRVLFDPVRDANPFFHYMEALWMLSGSQNVDFPAMFAKQIREYSDDGVTLRGAYGYRWRRQWDDDQIDTVIHMLRRDKNTRRAVMAMWDAAYDLDCNTKDLPCNTHIYWRIVDSKLNMTVCNRSNDLVWGMLGANMVHMSILHEYIASAVEIPMGTYYQITNNLHVYEGWEDRYDKTLDNWYQLQPTFPRWIFGPTNLALHEAERFVEDRLDTDEPYHCRIIRDNAEPMLHAWLAHKEGDDDLAMHYAAKIHDFDWQYACINWLDRRKK